MQSFNGARSELALLRRLAAWRIGSASTETAAQGGVPRLCASVAGPSPLQQVPTVVTEGGTTVPVTEQTERPRTARAVYRQLKISSKKLTPCAKLVRKMRVEDALLQCDLFHRKGIQMVQTALRAARANGVHNHGLDASKLFVEHCYATPGQDLKRIKYHGKGRHGKMRRRRTHLTVILREDDAPRPRPHRIVPTWWQREQRRRSGEPVERRLGESKVRSVVQLKWKTQLRRMRLRAKEQRKENRRSKRDTSEET